MPDNFREETISHSQLKTTGVMSLAIAAFSISLCAPVFAADFANAKKVYAPASSYDRRIDFSSIREQYTVPSGTAKTASKKSSSSSTKSASAKTSTSKTVSSSAAHSPAAASATKSASTLAHKTQLKPMEPIRGTFNSVAATNGRIPTSKSISDMTHGLGSTAHPATIAKLKETAIQLEKSGKLEESQRVLTKVTQLAPNDKAAFHQLSELNVVRAKGYLKANNFPDALLAARQALAANPGNPEANDVLNQLYRRVGADPNDVSSRLKTASTLYAQTRYQEAEVEYQASLNVKATPDAHIGLGKVAQKLRGPAAGKAEFEHALELDSNSASAHRELGMLHLNNGDIVSANSELSRALILDPSDKAAGAHLTQLWQTQVSKLPSANSHLGLARAYQLNGDLQSAQNEYREVVRLDPNHPYLPAARQSFKIALAKQEAEKSLAAAKTLESQGLLREAYAKAQEAVAYAPGNTSYRLYEGEILEKLGQAAQAKEVYLSVLKDDPQNLSAVQKIKSLANVSAGLGLAAAGGLLPGGTGISTQPAGFPGTKFPMDAITAGSMLTTGGAANGQAVDHISSLSGFMGQLRNHMLTAKDTNQKFEDNAHKIMKQLVNPDDGSAVGGVTAAGGDSDSDIVKKLLAGPSPSASATSTAGTESGAAAALAGAAAALAAVKGSAAAPASSVANIAAPSAASSVAAPAAASSLSSASKNSSLQRLQDLEKQNKMLQEQLSKLKSVAEKKTKSVGHSASTASRSSSPAMNKSASAPATLPAASSLATPSSGFSPAGSEYSLPPSSPSVADLAQYATPITQAPSFVAGAGALTAAPGAAAAAAIPSVIGMGMQQFPASQNFPSAAQAQSIAAAQAQYLNPTPAQYAVPAQAPYAADASHLNSPQPLNIATLPASSAIGAPSLRPAIASAPQGVKFELKQIKPTLRDVQLKVSLRNDTDAPLNLSDKVQAVIKYNNLTEAEMKVAFDSPVIAPHSTVDGVVKVPFNKVDPTADLVLRNMPAPCGDELHIVKTAISQK